MDEYKCAICSMSIPNCISNAIYIGNMITCDSIMCVQDAEKRQNIKSYSHDDREPNGNDKKLIDKIVQFGLEMNKIPDTGEFFLKKHATKILNSYNIIKYACPTETAEHARGNNWIRYKVGDPRNGISLGDFFIKAIIKDEIVYEINVYYNEDGVVRGIVGVK